MKIDTICQFCGYLVGHRDNCPVHKMIKQDNTFIPSITEKLVNQELKELEQNAEDIKSLTP